MARCRSRRPPLPDAWTERHRRHGRPPAGRFSFPGRASGSSPALGRYLPQRSIAAGRRVLTPLAGGDTAESRSGILTDIAVLGAVPPGKAVLRSGARFGDSIYVTGELGGASAALQALLAGEKIRPRDFPRHFHPTPRVAAGEFLRGKATAMIDLSDGLSTDLTHICEESRVGAEIEAGRIPRARTGPKRHLVALEHALHGGEDYELLFTAPARMKIPARIAGVSIQRIGRISRSAGILLIHEDGRKQALRPAGWEHFRE